MNKDIAKDIIYFGNSNFNSLYQESKLFIDKSLWINSFFQSKSKTILITRTRAFGQTYNFSMLSYFCSLPFDIDGKIDQQAIIEKKKLFKSLKIGEFPDIIENHCGKYPCIVLDFKKELSIELFSDSFLNLIRKFSFLNFDSPYSN